MDLRKPNFNYIIQNKNGLDYNQVKKNLSFNKHAYLKHVNNTGYFIYLHMQILVRHTLKNKYKIFMICSMNLVDI